MPRGTGFRERAPTRKIWFYRLAPGRSLGKTNPMNDDNLAEFVQLQKTKADSPKNWTVDASSIDQTAFDQSVKNPNSAGEAPGVAMPKHGNDAKDGKNGDIGRGSHTSPASHDSHSLPDPPPDLLLPPRGDYQTLLSFQKAEVIYDLTFRFAHKFLAKSDRTIDQMIQSARSGKKNILEGSKAGLTSKETEIKLTNVARASLEELLDDYRDYLRARDLRLWDKDSKEALYVRKLGCKTPQTYEDYREFVETRSDEVIANIAICLIHQTNYLIDQQVRRLAQDFLKEGGLRERMTRARMAYRNGRSGRQGSNEDNAGWQGGGSQDGRSSPEAHSSPDSHSSQPQKPPGHRNPPRPGGQS